jgi:sugar lactone lactonase YvrE
MRKILLPLLAMAAALPLAAQTYDAPESIELDASNNRWLISNKGAGEILARDRATGALTVFTSLPSNPHGLEIMDTVLYVCDGARIRGYGLVSASEVFNLSLGATFLNGITHDASGNLFATDFTAKKIYRIHPADSSFNVFATGLTKSPNGIYYDGANNRCVFVNWGTSANIMQVSLLDSSVSVVKATTLSNIDGITRDGAGNWFVASWGINGISMFDPDFTTGPGTVVTGLSSPADIAYDVATDTLASPNSGAALNNCTFHYMGGVVRTAPALAEQQVKVGPSPNEGLLHLYSPAQFIGEPFAILDANGQAVLHGKISAEETAVDVNSLPGGHYLISLREGRDFIRFTILL